MLQTERSRLLYYRTLLLIPHVRMSSKKYKIYYQTLEIPENSDQETLRKAYIDLVKKYHPDSGTPYADAEKFHKVDEAFRILTEKHAKERWQAEYVSEKEVKEQDIKHTAPQHRQYLNFEGIGTGNPFQRQKQFSKYKAMKAVDNVLQHRISKTTADEKAILVKVPLKHNIKTKYGYERLVEDLIQEGMSKGIFDNLSGSGKPLPDKTSRNPYVDFVTHKVNEVLIENGFCPEWITLQKEIRQEIEQFRKELSSERSYLGPHPLSESEEQEWQKILKKYEDIVTKINKKIDKFNLLVPVLDKQMVQTDLQKEAQKILLNGQQQAFPRRKTNIESNSDITSGEQESFLGFFDVMFKKFL